jgi:hypothetical protein
VRAPGVVVDEDVVEEDEDEVTDEILEHVIHQGLECGQSVGEPEGLTVFSTSASFIRTWW